MFAPWLMIFKAAIYKLDLGWTTIQDSHCKVVEDEQVPETALPSKNHE